MYAGFAFFLFLPNPMILPQLVFREDSWRDIAPLVFFSSLVHCFLVCFLGLNMAHEFVWKVDQAHNKGFSATACLFSREAIKTTHQWAAFQMPLTLNNFSAGCSDSVYCFHLPARRSHAAHRRWLWQSLETCTVSATGQPTCPPLAAENRAPRESPKSPN